MKKILIDTSNWSYLNILIVSNNPDAFILNSGFDPVTPRNTILSAENEFELSSFKKMNIKFLLLRENELKSVISNNPNIKRISVFNDWEIHSLD